MALNIGKSLDASCAAPWMKTKAAMCCVTIPVQPTTGTVKSVDFGMSAACSVGGSISEMPGSMAELSALRKQKPAALWSYGALTGRNFAPD
ncbi:hypothetical protein ACF1BQ_021800 [Bradyrhizobium sp. RDT10]